jgi:hypothetical protein
MEASMRILAVLTLFMFNPALALCQRLDPPPRIDLTGSVGLFTNHRTDSPNCCGGSGSGLVGLGGGFYWTDHLKTEIELSAPGTTRAGGDSQLKLSDGGFAPAFDQHTFHDLVTSADVVYQGGRNVMFHPFGGAGIDVDRERDELHRVFSSGGRTQNEYSDTTSTLVRPFITAGFKEYLSERTFFRGEIKIAFDGRAQQVIWKAGVGADFSGHAARSTPPRAAQDPPELWLAYSTRLPIGSTVTIRTTAGDHFSATLLAVDDTGVTVKPRAREPEPVLHVPFDRLAQLEIQGDGQTPASRAAAVGTAVTAGAGVFWGLFAILCAAVCGG